MIKATVKSVRVKDLGLNRIRKETRLLKKTFALVGFPGDAGEHKNSDLSLAQIAAINEFGSRDKKIPSRPFMRNASSNKVTHRQFKKILAVELLKIENLNQTAKGALRSAGEWYIGVLKTSIKKGPFKPNAESTKQAKGSSTPLIDTGGMRNSITSRIEQRGVRSR